MMKGKTTIKTLLFAGAIALLATSCKKGCMDSTATNYNPDAKKEDKKNPCLFDSTVVVINGVTYNKIFGTIKTNTTFKATENYLLSGGVFVEDGVTLTIEAGTTINTADDGTTPFLSIKRGGKLMACGTSSSPIVFTPIKSSPNPGEWGGIILNGKAPINVGAEATGEGGTGLYGGSDPTDNSGKLCYVRVEYAGKLLSTDNELNGFSFNGVGSGTELEYLQAYKGADDGFEFFGGTASLKYAVSTGNEDDSFDWTQGWTGNGQFWVAQQGSNGGDRGIEGDNLEDNNTVTPYSNPTLSNITLVGLNDGDDLNQALKLREGTKGSLYNVVATGFPKRGCQVEHNQSITNMNNGELTFQNSIIDNVSPFKFTSSAGNDTTVTNMFDQAVNNNQAASDGSLASFLNGYIGTSSTGAFNTSGLSSWFTSANYIGAVQSGSDWTANWTKAL